MKPLFLQIPLTDAIKLPPYSKYMKYIVTNKIKVPNEAISTMLANYSFSVKNNYVRTALCDLGAGVSVIPFSLYKRLCLEKLIPTYLSLSKWLTSQQPSQLVFVRMFLLKLPIA